VKANQKAVILQDAKRLREKPHKRMIVAQYPLFPLVFFDPRRLKRNPIRRIRNNRIDRAIRKGLEYVEAIAVV
jgi:uncharacterized membrane protein